MFSKKFICASERFSTVEKHVPAPCFRRAFETEPELLETATVSICGLGFYDLYLNGKRLTKGLFAPYVSAPVDLVYYDTYDVLPALRSGKNVLGIILGNGLQNNPGRKVSMFDSVPWRSYVRLAAALELTYRDGRKELIEGDREFRVHDSPVIFDDLLFGEHYDARKELPGWNLPDFDDSRWRRAKRAELPVGAPTVCEAEPITEQSVQTPDRIEREGKGFRYHFPKNGAGICTLRVKNTVPGQAITLTYGEIVVDGKLNLNAIEVKEDKNDPARKKLTHVDRYICKGADEEGFTPRFTFHGFQYVLVQGITENQADKGLLTFHVMNSDLKEAGSFRCSDDCINALQQMTKRSDLSCIYYFPMDCPQREKNGWTGDAAISAEQMILNLDMTHVYHEWFKNIRASQFEDGSLSAYVPTSGGGYDDPGSSWDSLIAIVPYLMYRYRGDRRFVEENAGMLCHYLSYISTRRDADGLLSYGYGDWVQSGVVTSFEDENTGNFAMPDCPVSVVNTASGIDIARKARFLFTELGMKERALFAGALEEALTRAFREKLLDGKNGLIAGNCQTSQCVGLFYNLFTEAEKPLAVKQLLRFIDAHGGHMSVGILGSRMLFHVLSQYGQSELACNMITRRDPPSYGYLYASGATTLWENFNDCTRDLPGSKNHHFWGDVSHWFISELAGIHINPSCTDPHTVLLRPRFVRQLETAEGRYRTVSGELKSSWKRDGDRVLLRVSCPRDITGTVEACDGYLLADGSKTAAVKSGEFIFVRK